MNIQLADALEEFDLRYIESCNQCQFEVKSDLTLSSPLLDQNEFQTFTNTYSNKLSKFPIFNDKKLALKEKTFNINFRPPLRPNFEDSYSLSSLNSLPSSLPNSLSGSLPNSLPNSLPPSLPHSNRSSRQNSFSKNLGNPYYKSRVDKLESPSKRRKIDGKFDSDNSNDDDDDEEEVQSENSF
ncbi:hypothetical protein CLIB1444_07S05930 [[Candida] jaroonii]|uniref:Uncharacterized protein n=1 Tax=[Candida] jaroonii TaxID=467808 RepID=A0ACA9YA56_9ASCO|nr:hypothetical protein CLIB1444_07S05930 [[Candida] jaroonii]